MLMLVVQQTQMVTLMPLVPEVVVPVALEVLHQETIMLVMVVLDRRSHLSLVLFLLLQFLAILVLLDQLLDPLDYMVVEVVVALKQVIPLVPPTVLVDLVVVEMVVVDHRIFLTKDIVESTLPVVEQEVPQEIDHHLQPWQLVARV
jgi:hypothetical protein